MYPESAAMGAHTLCLNPQCINQTDVPLTRLPPATRLIAATTDADVHDDNNDNDKTKVALAPTHKETFIHWEQSALHHFQWHAKENPVAGVFFIAAEPSAVQAPPAPQGAGRREESRPVHCRWRVDKDG